MYTDNCNVFFTLHIIFLLLLFLPWTLTYLHTKAKYDGQSWKQTVVDWSRVSCRYLPTLRYTNICLLICADMYACMYEIWPLRESYLYIWICERFTSYIYTYIDSDISMYVHIYTFTYKYILLLESFWCIFYLFSST